MSDQWGTLEKVVVLIVDGKVSIDNGLIEIRDLADHSVSTVAKQSLIEEKA